MRTEAPRMMIIGTTGSGSFGGPIREGTVLSPFSNSPVLQFPDMSRMQVSAEVAEADFKKIEKELTYPGQIKVTVIREMRSVDYAK
jgi:HD superfamily phosphodiesterase